MKKSYLFYGAVVAVVAIDYLIGNVGNNTIQMIAEVAPVEPLEEVTAEENSTLDFLLSLLPMAFGIAAVPMILKLFKELLEP